MIKATTPISLDVVEKTRIQVINAKQFDTGARELKIRITNKGVPVFVEQSNVVTVNAFREADEDSKAFLGHANEDGTATVPITAWMLELETTVICDVSVYDAQDNKLSTLNFDLIVEKANYSGDEISSDENYDLLINLLSDVAEAKEAETARVQAETARVQAEERREELWGDPPLSLLANALKGEKRGEVLSLGEVSPIPHKVKVTARSKNLLPFPYSTTGYKEQNGGKFTVQGDGGIALSGTPTAYASIQLYNGKPFSKGVVTLSLQGTFTSAAFDIALQSNGVTIASPSTTGTTLTINFADYPTCDAFLIGIKRGANGVEMTGTVYVMVEEGSNVTEWSPYVDVTAVKSRNIIPYPYANGNVTSQGITFTNNNDGTYTVNGTTASDQPAIITLNNVHLEAGKVYTLSSGTNSNYYTVCIRSTDGTINYFSAGATPTQFTIEQTGEYKAIIRINQGTSPSNVKFYPMLNYGDTALPFEKYFEPRPLNLKSCGKNLLPYPYYEKTKTVNGITFTDNGDGSVTANGTATGTAAFQLVRGFSIKAGQYTLSGCPVGGNKDTKFGLNFNDFEFATGGTPSFNAVWDVGNGNTAVISKDVKIFADIIIRTGYVANNLTFYPQIELGDTATEYEQYKAGETLAVTDANNALEFMSIDPNMTIIHDARDVVLNAEYNRDANIVVAGLEERFAKLEAMLTTE